MKLLTTPTSHKASRTTNNVHSIALPLPYSFLDIAFSMVPTAENELQRFESGIWNRELLYREC